MRTIIMIAVLALAAVGCGGGGDESAAFCDSVEQLLTLGEDIEGAEDPLELLDQIEPLMEEIQENAPEEIAAEVETSFGDPEDMEASDTVAQFIEDECGLEVPEE